MHNRGLIDKAVLLTVVAPLCCVACSQTPIDETWLQGLHIEARDLFFSSVAERIAVHSERDRLTDVEIRKITESRVRYEKLPDILLNVYYQKDEPLHSQLIERGGRSARSQLRDEYLALAHLAADQYVECFFQTDDATDTLRANIQTYADLDAVDLVIRSIGYDAKLEVPEREPYANDISPEFDLQSALDAARFRGAHQLTTGAGTKIAILDTGIDTLHSIFRNTTMGRHFSLVGRTGAPWSCF